MMFLKVLKRTTLHVSLRLLIGKRGTSSAEPLQYMQTISKTLFLHSERNYYLFKTESKSEMYKKIQYPA